MANNNAAYNEFVDKLFGPEKPEKPLTGFENFASQSFANNSLELSELTSGGPPTAKELEVMPVYRTMSPEEKEFFKPQIRELLKKIRQNAGVAAKLADIAITIKNTKEKGAGLGRLNAKNMSFRGKNGPVVYLAPTSNGSNTEVRINYSVDGLPFRVTHPSSFNAALASMKSKRRNVSQKRAASGKLLDVLESKYRPLKAEYDARQQEIAVLVTKLGRDLKEFRRRKLGETEEYTRTSEAPSTPSAIEQELQQAREVHRTGTAPAAPAPSTGRRWWPFGKKKGGKTRRTNSRKSRKNRKNSRR